MRKASPWPFFLLLVFYLNMVAESNPALAVTDSQIQAAAFLRQYCQACHAVGEKRFITSDDDAAVWTFIGSNRLPKNPAKTWAEEIAKVLSWPTDDPPPFDKPMEPNRDWMPKGGKRLQFANGMMNGQSVRRVILDQLAQSAD